MVRAIACDPRRCCRFRAGFAAGIGKQSDEFAQRVTLPGPWGHDCSPVARILERFHGERRLVKPSPSLRNFIGRNEPTAAAFVILPHSVRANPPFRGHSQVRPVLLS